MIPKKKFKPDEYDRFCPVSRLEWREWLEKNHGQSSGIWLVTYKKHTGKPTVSYNDAVEEALCFGWIDSKPQKLDDERTMLLYTPRKPKSVWSRPNKIRIEKLMEQGLMAEAGLLKIEAAKADGSWTLLDAIEDLVVPPDLQAALNANPPAAQYWDAFGISVKKGILWWIESAKRTETRQKRVEETVALAAENKKANQWRPS